MPDFREGHFVIQMSSSIPGTSLAEMLSLGKRVSAEVLALPYVKTIEQHLTNIYAKLRVSGTRSPFR